MDGNPQSPAMARGGGWIATFFPGYFAAVMATGIVSLAWHLQGFSGVARVLFWLNVPAYLLLWGITLVRLVAYRVELVKDLTSHARGATFLTMVAATSVLGKQFIFLSHFNHAGKWLWLVAVILWVGLIYTFFVSVTVREPKPKLEVGLNGGWLLIVVSTESLCTLGTLTAPAFGDPEAVYFMSLVAYLLGAMFYIVLITLIVYRWTFRSMEADMLTPPYWINMGALAITTLAGARLLMVIEQSSAVAQFRTFIPGFTLFFWATATWWIPLLLLVGVWRHVSKRLPLSYDPQYWSLVFPLGMYSAATNVFGQVTGLPFLQGVARGFAWLALLAWLVTFWGLLVNLGSAVRRRTKGAG